MKQLTASWQTVHCAMALRVITCNYVLSVAAHSEHQDPRPLRYLTVCAVSNFKFEANFKFGAKKLAPQTCHPSCTIPMALHIVHAVAVPWHGLPMHCAQGAPPYAPAVAAPMVSAIVRHLAQMSAASLKERYYPNLGICHACAFPRCWRTTCKLARLVAFARWLLCTRHGQVCPCRHDLLRLHHAVAWLRRSCVLTERQRTRPASDG
jgi:hypothetical protein